MTPTLQLQAFEWRNEYETGLPEIDRQHRQMVRLINELNAAMQLGKGRDVLGSILDRLAAYTVTHFQTEEGLMTAANWTGFVDHQRKHRKLVSEVSNLQSSFKLGRVSITIETMDFLKRWLHTHILEEDMTFTKSLTSPK